MAHALHGTTARDTSAGRAPCGGRARRRVVRRPPVLRRGRCRTVVLAVLLAAAVLGAVVVSGAFAPPAVAGPDAGQIDAFLAGHASPMAGTGAVFVAEGQAHGVDPAFLVAIAGAETGFGQYLYQRDGDVCAFNAFNWFYGPTWPESDFASWDEAIARVAEGLAGGLYHQAGLVSVAAIAPVYCPDGTAEWVANVTAFTLALGGDPADTRIPVSGGPPQVLPGLLVLDGRVEIAGPRRPRVGDEVTARFTVENRGGEPLLLDAVTLAVRDREGGSYDLSTRTSLVLDPGAAHVFVATWPLHLAGSWSGWIEVEQGGLRSLVGPERAFRLQVRAPNAPHLRRAAVHAADAGRS